jgi:beta-N-acetylhexosaminidase
MSASVIGANITRSAGRRRGTGGRWVVETICMLLIANVCGCGEAQPPTVRQAASPTPVPQTESVTQTGATSPSTPAQIAQAATSGGSSSSPARMLGQMIVARFAGQYPPLGFLARIRAGHIGGVILFADNLAGGPSPARKTIATLQRAAADGGNPPLLIMTDQEGGTVRRLSWAPPTIAASAMDSSSLARAEGEAAGRALRSVGINLDLAPVADVVHVPESFLGTRAFGSNAATVASRACAFADGLAAEGVGFTLKHFPGLGWATADTDAQPVTVGVSAETLRSDYRAYRLCGAEPTATVMVSSAAYPGLTGRGDLPAALSPEIYREELPYAVGGVEPVTITDDLQTASILDQVRPAQQAIAAGVDLLMYAQTESASNSAYHQLLSSIRTHRLSAARVREASQAIAAYKLLVAEPSAAASMPSSGNNAAVPVAPTGDVGTPTTIRPSGEDR